MKEHVDYTMPPNVTLHETAFRLHLKIRDILLEPPPGGALGLCPHVRDMSSCVPHSSLLAEVFPWQ